MDVREGTSGTSADVPGRRSWSGVGLVLKGKMRKIYVNMLKKYEKGKENFGKKEDEGPIISFFIAILKYFIDLHILELIFSGSQL